MSSISQKIKQEVLSLPVHDRIEMIDLLIKSLNLQRDQEIDRLWEEEAERRVSDLTDGSTTSIPGKVVFSNLKDIFAQ